MTKTEREQRAQVMDFERELLYAFRGELRRVNAILPPSEQNSGLACRVAAAAVLKELSPVSEQGRNLLAVYLKQRPPMALYSGAPTGGNGRKEPRNLVSLLRIEQNGGDHGEAR